MKRRNLFVLKAVFVLSALLLSSGLFSGCSRPAQRHSETGFYFDTVITITVYREEEVPLIRDCFDLCASYEQLFSRTLEGSDIYRINHSGGEPVEVSLETAELLGQAVYYAKLSQGRVDPTVAPLTDLWDFGGTAEGTEQNADHTAASQPDGQDTGSIAAPKGQNADSSAAFQPDAADAAAPSDQNISGRVPDAETIRSVLPHINYKEILIEGNTVTLTDPEARIDLGFIAKGYIADRLKEYLVSNGVTSALLNLGGNVLCVGSKPDGTSFTIGLQRPFGAQGETVGMLSVSDLSIVSSGIYERCFEENGTLYHHILDPSTGYPVENGLLGVTILSSSSLEGDALSTTCFCLGLEDGMALAESLPGVEAAFITEDYEVHTTDGFDLTTQP